MGDYMGLWGVVNETIVLVIPLSCLRAVILRKVFGKGRTIVVVSADFKLFIQ